MKSLGKKGCISLLAIGAAFAVQTTAFAAYNEFSFPVGGTVATQQVSDIDSYGNKFSWMQVIAGRNNSNGTITLTKLQWYSGTSSPEYLYYGPCALVDSVNSSNTIFLYGDAPSNTSLLGTNYTSSSSFSWTGNSRTNLYAYLKMDIGKASGMGSSSPNITGTSTIVLKPR